jgi:hypothetical protein
MVCLNENLIFLMRRVERGIADEIRYVPADEDSQPAIGEGMKTEEIALYALHVDDDPYLNILGLVNGKS